MKKLVGYYSMVFLQDYYDGYGFNFYYGLYGYYEDSDNDTEMEVNPTAVWIWTTIILVTCVIPLICGIVKMKQYQK
jgi:hypothetical protein